VHAADPARSQPPGCGIPPPPSPTERSTTNSIVFLLLTLLFLHRALRQFRLDTTQQTVPVLYNLVPSPPELQPWTMMRGHRSDISLKEQLPSPTRESNRQSRFKGGGCAKV